MKSMKYYYKKNKIVEYVRAVPETAPVFLCAHFSLHRDFLIYVLVGRF